MDNFLDSLLTPSWWIAVVVVGIIINLISAYLKDPIDNFLSHISTKWRTKKSIEKEKYNAMIAILKDDSDLLLLYALSENRFRIRSIAFLLLSFFIFFVSTYAIDISNTTAIIGLVLSLISALFGLHDHYKAMQISEVIKNSNNKYKEINF